MKNKTFTTKNIKSSYVVELRNGSRYVVTRARQNDFSRWLVNKNTGIAIGLYDEDLCYKGVNCERLDIVKVWGLAEEPMLALCISNTASRPLLWERPKAKKMTRADIEKILGYDIEIIDEE